MIDKSESYLIGNLNIYQVFYHPLGMLLPIKHTILQDILSDCTFYHLPDILFYQIFHLIGYVILFVFTYWIFHPIKNLI